MGEGTSRENDVTRPDEAARYKLFYQILVEADQTVCLYGAGGSSFATEASLREGNGVLNCNSYVYNKLY